METYTDHVHVHVHDTTRHNDFITARCHRQTTRQQRWTKVDQRGVPHSANRLLSLTGTQKYSAVLAQGIAVADTDPAGQKLPA